MRHHLLFSFVLACSFGCARSSRVELQQQHGHEGASDAAVVASDAEVPRSDAGTFDASVHHGRHRDAGTHGSAGVDAGEPDAAPDPWPAEDAGAGDAGAQDYPRLLSETGLFSDLARDVVAPGVRAYEPKYKLWSDGASKRRWLHLPNGAKIDTSDMDHWVYPVGTKVWKEFSVQGVRVETRLLAKVAAERWVTVSYQWRADLSDAEAVPEGVENANGTQHDVPSAELCLRCHGNMRDRLLGVTAIQLSHDLGGVSLQTLIDEQRLSRPPAGPFQIPGGATAERALGYFHANCGHCHNPQSAVYAEIKSRAPYTGGPRFWEKVSALGSLTETEGYASTVEQPNSVLPNLHIVEPGSPSQSELFVRIGQRGPGSLQMPPIATEVVDTEGMAAIAAWISSLAPDAGAAADAGSAARADAGAQPARDAGW
jgi:cytochrome c553